MPPRPTPAAGTARRWNATWGGPASQGRRNQTRFDDEPSPPAGRGGFAVSALSRARDGQMRLSAHTTAAFAARPKPARRELIQKPTDAQDGSWPFSLQSA